MGRKPKRRVPVRPLTEFEQKSMDWLDAQKIGTHTRVSYMRAMQLFFDWLFEREIYFPTLDDLQVYHEWIRQTQKPNSLRIYLSISSRLLQNYTNEFHTVPPAPGPGKSELEGLLTPEDAARIIRKLDLEDERNLRDLTVLLLQLYSPLSITKILDIRFEDLVHAHGALIVLYQRFRSPDKEAVYIVPPLIRSVLEKYLKASGRFTGSRGDAFVFTDIGRDCVLLQNELRIHYIDFLDGIVEEPRKTAGILARSRYKTEEHYTISQMEAIERELSCL